MDTHIAPAPLIPEDATPPIARLPGETQEFSAADGHADGASVAPDPEGHGPAAGRAPWKRSQLLLLGAAVVSLGVAGTSAVFVSRHGPANSARRPASMGPRVASHADAPLAPSASLAGVPLPSSPATVVARSTSRAFVESRESLDRNQTMLWVSTATPGIRPLVAFRAVAPEALSRWLVRGTSETLLHYLSSSQDLSSGQQR